MKVEAEPPAPDFSRHAEAIKEAIARESAPERRGDAARRTPERAEAAAERRSRRRAERPVAERRPEPVADRPRQPVPDDARGRAGARARRRPGGRARASPRRGRTARSRDAGAEDTMSQPARPPADDPETTAARPPTPGADEDDRPRRRERILFGESDDLLADVDTGVNENEFKW